MPKILRPLTIIPSELYVERQADRQLALNIESMGRPGYVLVARQMGKTNLLLNAKRRAERDGISFAYLDVSNQFPTLRSFFRNVIDTIVETDDAEFASVAPKLLGSRSGSERLPHKEHEWELRTLLQSTQRRVVICLDEIDALTNSDYSDQVFSFIRSIYFAGRSNFPEFLRLTYLLSGVAEPADIIKNRDVSPFNIGEKIFLEDFDLEEVGELVRRAKLVIPDDACRRVFHWTSGHPRMTWDVCAAIEDASAAGIRILPSVVDELVRRLYFSDVDVPPIDHIRRLAEESPDIRDSLVSIHYGRGDSISEPVRTRLYLAGISKNSPDGPVTRFKNRVIEEALSEEFLLALRSPSEHHTLELAIRQFVDGNFDLAATALETISLKASDSSLRGRATFWLAKSRFRQQKYEEVVRLARMSPKLGNFQESLELQLLEGLALMRQEKFSEAIEPLRRCQSAGETPEAQRVALEAGVNWAFAVARVQQRTMYEEAEDFCVAAERNKASVLHGTGLVDSPAALLVRAHMARAQICQATGRSSQAGFEYDAAMEVATLDLATEILVLRHDQDAYQKRRSFFLSSAAERIRTASAFSVDTASESNAVSYQTCFDVFSRLERVGRRSEANALIRHILSVSSNNYRAEEAIETLAALAISSAGSALALSIFEQALSNRDLAFPLGLRRSWLSTLCAISSKPSMEFTLEYLTAVTQDSEPPRIAEFFALYRLAVFNIDSGNKNYADLALQALRRQPLEYATFRDEEKRSWSLLNDYLASYRGLTGVVDAGVIAKARNVLQRVQEFRGFDLGGFPQNMASVFQTTLVRLLRRHGEAPDRRVGRKIGRNDLVTVDYSGTRVTGKYKKFAQDIAAGQCRVVQG